MLTLGIETSCDETSAAIVQDGRLVVSNVISSQVAVHAPYGGVVPEIASRHHVEAINWVVRRAMEDAGKDLEDLGAVAATYGPGLAGALMVGLNFARGLALSRRLPFIPVNHLEGHLHSVWLGRQKHLPEPPPLPMLVLIVSGGHTELVLMRAHGDYEVIGRTRDDAAGEAFDKVGRLLGLPYPGGPSIQVAADGAEAPTHLPRAWLPRSYDFSFSGLKTAAMHAAFAAATGEPPEAVRRRPLPNVDVARDLTASQVADIAAGFQESVVDVLVTKTAAAASDLHVRSVGLVGGVAANRSLRKRMEHDVDLPLFLSAPEFSTDNAAMVAAAAFFVPREDDVDVEPSLGLTAAGTM